MRKKNWQLPNVMKTYALKIEDPKNEWGSGEWQYVFLVYLFVKAMHVLVPDDNAFIVLAKQKKNCFYLI